MTLRTASGRASPFPCEGGRGAPSLRKTSSKSHLRASFQRGSSVLRWRRARLFSSAFAGKPW